MKITRKSLDRVRSQNLEGAQSTYKPTEFIGNKHQLNSFLKEYYPKIRQSFIILNPLTNRESDFFMAYTNEVLQRGLLKKGIKWTPINSYLIAADKEGKNKKWYEGTEEEYHYYKRKHGTPKEKEAYKIMDMFNKALEEKF